MPSSPLLLELPTTQPPAPLTPGLLPRPRIARPTAAVSPALALVTHAEERNQLNGHENLGFLSLGRGFLPREDPLLALPPRFAAWDQLAAELPRFYASLDVRQRVEQLPLLDASKTHLDDKYVLRATAVLAILSHAYWYCKPTAAMRLPEVLTKPWAQLRARLGRRQEAITYIDLIVYNWRRVDPSGPLTVENLTLLLPTIGNREERVFYLTQLEILARCTEVLQTMLAAQGAVLAEDGYRTESALCQLSHQLEGIVRTSLPKISPHGYSSTGVDAVTWAKTVAPFAVPIHPGDLGPSGTSSPIFNALDIFLGRKRYSSFLGKEIQQLRTVYPPFWRAFMLALSRVNLSGFVANSKSSSLREAYKLANDTYAGDGGFLGRHRMKVYGFLELAFKVGRAVTIGGFGGAFKDRTWDQVDTELTRSRVERPTGVIAPLCQAKVSIVPGTRALGSSLHRLRLTVVDGQRVQFQPGDHVQVWPSHSPRLVGRTLQAAGATGLEPVLLNPEWQKALMLRGLSTTTATLGTLLPLASLKRTSTTMARSLLAIRSNTWLKLSVEAGRLGQTELWRVFERLRADGYPLVELLRSPELLGAVLEPEVPRTYSIASESPRSHLGTRHFELAVRLHSHESGEGTASSYLCRAAETETTVPFAIQKAAAFGPPPDPATPVIAFAAGSGVAPILSLLAERLRDPSTRNWLILSLSRSEDFQFSQDWHAAVTSGQLRLDVVFTRQGATLVHDPVEGFSFLPGSHRHIQDLMQDAELTRSLFDLLSGRTTAAAASVYVCGSGSFSNTTQKLLEDIYAEHASGDPSERRRIGREAVYGMAGQRRLTVEAHSDAAPILDDGLFTPADVAAHNSPSDGYWVSIDDGVYDLTEFRQLHPGGARIIDAYAGMDATHGFKRAHHGRADIGAQLATFRKGRLYNPVFSPHTALVESPQGPKPVDHAGAYRAYVAALNLCVEMENALRIDLSLVDRPVHPTRTEAEPSDYVWARQAETHHRFLATYVSVLGRETLPNLSAVVGALFGAGAAPSACQESEFVDPSAEEELATANLLAAQQLVTRASEQPNETPEELHATIVRLTSMDVALLADLKELLREAVNALAYRQSASEPASHPLTQLNESAIRRLRDYQQATRRVHPPASEPRAPHSPSTS